MGTPRHLGVSPMGGSPKSGRGVAYSGGVVGFNFSSANDHPHNKAAALESQPLDSGRHVGSGRHCALDHGIIGGDLVQVAQCGEVETGAVKQLGGTVGQHGHHTDVDHL